MQGIHESSSFSAVELWLPCDHDELRCVYASVARPQLLPWTQLSCACAFARGTGLPGRVYNHMSAILENRFDTLSAELDPRAPSARMFGLVTAIGMPVATGSRAGVLLLYSSQQIAQLSALSVACTQRMLRIVLASQVHPRFANISTLDLGHIAGLHQQHEHIRGLVDSSKRRRDASVEQTSSVKRTCTLEAKPSMPYASSESMASAPPPAAMHAVDMKPPPHAQRLLQMVAALSVAVRSQARKRNTTPKSSPASSPASPLVISARACDDRMFHLSRGRAAGRRRRWRPSSPRWKRNLAVQLKPRFFRARAPASCPQASASRQSPSNPQARTRPVRPE